ncbi:LysR family transcriptional regulator [Salinispirillum sp. LH 10-3-1]|uniref:LysR family transcriptional regulator n=1 Tax=Salinispirillum sp. LH 10-3-1 TaxID=2952525 RepID=A0AB38YGN5_9GAMM
MPDQTPNLRHLRAFQEVALAHSISAAAERVFLSQSALTQAIAKLEAAVGCLLFHRRHNGLFLTEEGKLFAKRVQRCLSLLQQGVRDAMRVGEKKQADRRGGGEPALLLTNVHLRALLALQHAPSYSGAARSIGLSQPAVYRAARDLEDSLNLLLFEKTSVGVALTRAAERLTRYTRLALKEITQGYDELSSLSGTDSTTIVVGSMPLARTYILPSAINRITQLKPDLRISVVEGPYDDLLHRLLYGEVDLLIGALRDPAPTNDVVQEALFDTSISVVGRNGHPLAARTGLTVADLKGYRWVVPRSGTPARSQFDRVFVDADPDVLHGLVECSSQIVVRELLTGSDRLTFISSHQIQHEQEEGILTVLDTDIPATRRPIGLTLRTGWHPTPTQRLFVSIIKSLSEQVS